MYYNLTLAKKKNVVAHLREYDVIVTTPHIKLPQPILRNVKFHRLVVDESHLLEQNGAGTMSGRADALIEYQVRRPKLAPPAARRAHRSCTRVWQTKYVWLVTGTPFSTSLSQLKHQSHVLGQTIDGLHLKRSRLRGAALASAHGSAVASAHGSAALSPWERGRRPRLRSGLHAHLRLSQPGRICGIGVYPRSTTTRWWTASRRS